MIDDFFKCRKAKQNVEARAKVLDEKRKNRLSKLNEIKQGVSLLTKHIEKMKGQPNAPRRTNIPHPT